ncbi:hypothetical protein HPB50_007249 [Hyalomma asiaticum]|uniref:Uncharacterized protein n=1 Tax=Hyalomma asiaticum TaxID=266040 RepID=A0ACB7TG48_HYAAI|nr:hypothetical protein HPB50_007249 [Hyalomma asiaticum]
MAVLSGNLPIVAGDSHRHPCHRIRFLIKPEVWSTVPDNGNDDMQFRELLGKLRALWTTEKFGEKQDDIWRLLKREVPRRSRSSCHTVHDLLDILIDREVITPQETVLLVRLAAVFSIQEASEHIQAFRKIPLDKDACSVCSAPCHAPLLYHIPVQENPGETTV